MCDLVSLFTVTVINPLLGNGEWRQGQIYWGDWAGKRLINPIANPKPVLVTNISDNWCQKCYFIPRRFSFPWLLNGLLTLLCTVSLNVVISPEFPVHHPYWPFPWSYVTTVRVPSPNKRLRRYSTHFDSELYNCVTSTASRIHTYCVTSTCFFPYNKLGNSTISTIIHVTGRSVSCFSVFLSPGECFQGCDRIRIVFSSLFIATFPHIETSRYIFCSNNTVKFAVSV
jgi:hypothetical protein